MSLSVVIKAPEGMVLATESRVILTYKPPFGEQVFGSFDNAIKLFSIKEPYNNICIANYGLGAIGTGIKIKEQLIAIYLN
jgi:hypothetical protein